MILLQIQSIITVFAATAESQPWFYGVLFKVGPFIIVLGLLIFFHEMGHFLAAKFFGVKVERFSFGLGPRLVGLKVGETDYRISAFPLGGYVKMVGEGLDDEVLEEEKERSFSFKAVWKRMLIVVCGPLFYFFFALGVFFLVFLLVGQVILTSEVGEVKPDYPAYKAGLRSGDKIISMAGRPITTWKELPDVVRKNAGKAIPLIFVRGDRQYKTEVTPISSTVKNLFGEDVQETVIGVSPSGKYITKDLGLGEAFQGGVVQTYEVTKLTVVSLVKLVERKVPLETLGGPIFIAQLAGQQAQEGWANLLLFTALLSVNLGILNLLPIPILDGGHLVFFAIEWISGKPLSLKKREIAQQVGMFILILLMVFVFYNDILRIIQ
ncbi:MAG: RIP metalloprotease RseP [Deltaproteobacteria bacterium]|nr:RIP metalloprotease RseP [Deltaproteobacteria bacterium]